ncbi:hypothetical protein HGP16_18655 [Rhizobium sp. P40RR-XXII]|uniref:hypothetical protein n=1 Tax=Rhizobium sp. P40RR-XXII TaxID=2726739 RepID=UPI00145660C5|nr:hypothetical protein [Rhizobium sp. P40RR-XXII]NLS18581.1 hypothetical protein [Rhizobium sp. P40RR-XXII]
MRLLLALVLVGLAALILAFLQSTTPSYAVLTGPIETIGRQKDAVSSRTFRIKVHKIICAKTLAFTRYGKPIERQTEGVWVIASVELQTRQETMKIQAAAIEGASGRLYRQSHRADGAPGLVSTKTLQPGLSSTGIIIFELPEADAHDITLVVSKQPSPQLDSEIRVKLNQSAIEIRDRAEIGDNGV